MSLLNEKEFKEKLNKALSSTSYDEMETNCDVSFSEDTTETSHDEVHEDDSLEDIISKCERALSMKKTATENSEQVKKQLNEVKEKLDSNDKYLQEMKKTMENFTFSSQKKELDLHKLEPSACLEKDFKYKREQITQLMENIKKLLDGLRVGSEEKRQAICDSYKEAFKQITDFFQRIDDGTYSSEVFEFIS